MRWLLLFFATEEFPLQVQIVEWTPRRDAPNPLKELNEPQEVDTGKPLDPHKVRIHSTERPLRLEFQQRGNRCYIQAVFHDGSLDIIADPQKGIVNTAWSAEETDDHRRVERCSYGEMHHAIAVQHHVDERHWRDDAIFDENDERLIPEGFKTGSIRGADSPHDDSDCVYLASSQTRVFRLDKKYPEQEPWQSARMAGMVLDVLVVKMEESAHAVLAATQNGKIYYLTADTDKKKLDINYWQPTGDHHIVRLIGFGGSDVLAIDERGEILPLRLVDPNQFTSLRERASAILAKYFFDQRKTDSPDSIAQNKLQSSPEEFGQLARLDLECFLLHTPPTQTDYPALMLGWYKWLSDNSPEMTVESRAERAKVHGELICRLIHWMQQTALREFKGSEARQRLSEKHIETIFTLLTPKETAADYLWLPLLRFIDWPRLWAQKIGLLPKDALQCHLSDWEAKLQRVRTQFLPGLAEVRPLVTSSGRYLASYANHIEIIDETKGLIAVSEYAWGIRIYRLTDDPEHWEACAELPAEEIADGQILFLRVLPCQRLGLESSKIPMLIGTVRGELILLLYDVNEETLESTGKKINSDASIICSRNASSLDGILLGGRTPDGRAVLLGWSYKRLKNCLAGADQRPTQLWLDQEKKSGALRLLRLSADGKQLWAINREQGCLYGWGDVPTGLLESNSRKLHDPIPWFESPNKLHALDYCAEQNLLACGGDGGMAWAFGDQGKGMFRWAVNGSGNMRRVRHLPGYRSPESPDKTVTAWLLCGHYQSNLIVDSDANMLGVLEKTGPVSAVTVMPVSASAPARLLIGTLEGRLMAMRFVTEKPNSTAQPALANDPAAYPVRCMAESIDSSVLMKLLDTPLDGDSLCNMRVLKSSADYLRESSIDSGVEKKLLAFLSTQPLERQVVFLYWLRKNGIGRPDKTDLRDFALKLAGEWLERLTACEENRQTGLLCKVLSPLLDLLDTYQAGYSETADLRKAFTNYLWRENSKEGWGSLNGMNAARWDQAAKRWRNLHPSKDTPSRMFAWCNAMAKECGAQNAEELKKAFVLLAEWKLSFLGQSDPWTGWIPDLLQQKKHPAPDPLSLLETLRERPFDEHELERLEMVFAGNTAWRNWLAHLQTLLSGLETVKAEQPHYAWKEMSSLDSLREWLVSIGRHRFSVEQEQALLSLWWWRIENHWQQSIDKARQQLHQRWVNQRKDYLQLSEALDRWRNERDLELSLFLVNRSPEKLHVEEVFWQDGSSLEKQSLDSQPKLPVLLLADKEAGGPDGTGQHRFASLFGRKADLALQRRR